MIYLFLEFIFMARNMQLGMYRRRLMEGINSIKQEWYYLSLSFKMKTSNQRNII